MKFKALFAPRVRHKTFAVLTVIAVVCGIAIHSLLAYVIGRQQLYLDTTPEGLYTVTDRMIEECEKLLTEQKLGDEPMRMIFCADPDQLTESAPARAVYFLALQMQKHFDAFTVETVNLTYEPQAVADFKTTSLSTILPTDVILAYGDAYRITSIDSFWTTANDAYWSFNGEYKLASMILSLLGTPLVAYFTTGHGESVFDPADPTSEASRECATLYDLLTERGLEVRLLDLKTVDAVPEDCALLIINNPRTDFVGAEVSSLYDRSECEIIDRYLIERQGAVAVAKDYRVTLPNLEDLLFEYGFDFGDNAVVMDEEECLLDENGEPTVTLIGQYNSEEGSYGQAIYGDFASLSSAPSTIVSDSGYIRCAFDESTEIREDGYFYTSRNYTPFLSTSNAAEAYAYNASLGAYVDTVRVGVMDLCAASVRVTTNSHSSEKTYSYVFAAASASFFSEELLSNPSYANYEVVSSLVHNVARVDEHATTDLGGTSLNSTSFGGKQLLDTTIVTTQTDVYNSALEVVETNYAMGAGLRVFIMILTAIPAALVLAVGVAVAIRRRYL